MARKSFQEQLDKLRTDVLFMAEMVSDRLRIALSALESKDKEAARRVIEGDDEVNELYLELENDCIDLLALQQPVASDLRFIAASFKIITDLERIADLAVNLGDYTLEADRAIFPEVDVQAIGQEALRMLERAMDAYENEKSDACYEIADADDDLDEQCRLASERVVRDLIEQEIDEETPEDEIEQLMADVSRLFLTIRDLERIGDHSVNIAARTLYMAENDETLIY
ncbi:MAG: phosphate signaling complex protein PhoU [Halodesulfurarchaeum sp.]